MESRAARREISIVVVDDRVHARRALRALIDATPGLKAIALAANGLEAIAAVERQQPDVVVMDLVMPVMDGLEATTRIKQRWPMVSVLAMSVDADAGARALAAGADAFLAKGAAEAQLIGSIRDLADRHTEQA